MKTSNRINDSTVEPTLTYLHAPGFLKDLLLTLAAALWTGLAGSTLLLLLVFFLGGDAQAAVDGLNRGALARYSLDGRRIEDAPLLHTDVRFQISGILARVRVKQQFSNPGQDWLEGIYQFPLPENSAVDHLRMHIGNRIIEGEIQERQQAKASYAKAKSQGRRASLLSQERPNIFTASVANIGPGDLVEVEIEYQQILRYDQGAFYLRFPLVIGPRYIPGSLAEVNAEAMQNGNNGWAIDNIRMADASRITPPVADPADGLINPVSLSIHLDAGLKLESIKSSYHELIQQMDDQGVYHLQLQQGSVPADRDFELVWRPAAGNVPQTAIFTEQWEGQEYALLMLLPPSQALRPADQPREVIYVLDTSGSMHGASLAQAKAALQLALSRLHQWDRFNLIQFNSHISALFPRAVPASQKNVQRALGYLSGLQANGGTEMLPALAQAMKAEDDSHSLRQVIFLTDGSVANEQELFAMIQQELGDSRLFTVGIGSAPNSWFMRRAADFGRGSFTYIGDLTEVESAMQGLFLKLENPTLTDISLDWGDGHVVESYPPNIPDLYQGEPMVIALKTTGLLNDVVLEGQLGAAYWRHSVHLPQSSSQAGVHTLWARRKIAELMAARTLGQAEEVVRSQVLEVALQHQLVSRYTSLVAVDKTPARAPEAGLRQIPMPTNLPNGWSAAKVFGRLPQTATSAPLHLLLGIFFLLLGLFSLKPVRRLLR